MIWVQMHHQIYAVEQTVQDEANNTSQYRMNNGPGLSLVCHLFPWSLVFLNRVGNLQ